MRLPRMPMMGSGGETETPPPAAFDDECAHAATAGLVTWCARTRREIGFAALVMKCLVR
jgi:hypothetical protein